MLFCFSAALFTKLWQIIARPLRWCVKIGSTAGLREILGHPGHIGVHFSEISEERAADVTVVDCIILLTCT